ncbi:hypothetical protein MSAN_00046500 [Mycena sanguinolenta]|uniref:Uncharacterized protein n=1 Tax=Mycena sanguinolenta TaxID=230812 RepID=A0A8H6ZHC2_9AGAR|nr:hypothetical protein MSAN_00046500 [Mycena sanguinolenta]
MASEEQLTLSTPHAPKQHAIDAFVHVEHEIKHAILQSRHDWDKHEPKMWAHASQTSDQDLVHFTMKVTPPSFRIPTLLLTFPCFSIRSAETSYGPMIFGKIRIRAIKLDSAGELVPSEVKKDAHGKIEVEMKNGHIDDDKLGFIHVRIHDPPGEGIENVKFHSIFTDEGHDALGDNNGYYRAIQVNSKPLEFFNE